METMTKTKSIKTTIFLFFFKIAIPFFNFLDNLSYKILTILAVKQNGGIHPKHRIMNYHKFFVDNVNEDDVVVDVGCGNGLVAYDVSQKAKEVVGVDLSQQNIDRAVKLKNNNLNFVCGDATKYQWNRKFNVCILSNVLEHIADRVGFLKNIYNISDTILLRVPMLERDWLVVYKKEQGLEYRLDPTHFVEYTLSILEDELLKSGWKIKNYSIQFGEFWGVIIKS